MLNENRIPQVWRTPRYRISRLKLPKYRRKNCPIPQYCKPLCPPLLNLWNKWALEPTKKLRCVTKSGDIKKKYMLKYQHIIIQGKPDNEVKICAKR